MSGSMEDSANSIPRYIGHRELTEDDLRYNRELDRDELSAGKRNVHKLLLERKRM